MTPKRKSYTAKFKLKVVAFASKMNSETGKEFGSKKAAKSSEQ